jgi:hypothetical protein
LTPIEASFGVSTELHGERWESWRSAQPRLVHKIILQLLALFSGFDPVKTARQGYRATFEEREAKKRGGTGGWHALRAGTKIDRPQLESFHEETIVPEAGRSVEDAVLTRVDAKLWVATAEQRWGKRARVFLEHLAQDATVEEAAAAAGVSRQIGHKYLRKLKSHTISRKKAPPRKFSK